MINGRWTSEEDEIIKEFYPLESRKVACRLNGRSELSCYQRASKLGVRWNRDLGMLGRRFGRLEVLRREGTNKYGVRYFCICDCGKNHVVTSGHLRSGGVKSCGCGRFGRPLVPEGFAAFNKLYGGYKTHAEKVGMTFEFSREKFKKLTKSNCWYCGVEPSSVMKLSRSSSRYVYNGVDRVDNERGYSVDNCVPCCKTCNYAKRKLSISAFISWILRAADHLRTNGYEDGYVETSFISSLRTSA